MNCSIKNALLISFLAAIILSSMLVQNIGASSGSETNLPVVAASCSSYNGASYVAGKAIDGIESTSNYWGTSSALGLPQWLTLDLGSQVSMNKIVTHFYDFDGRTYTYHVDVSVDGSSWTSVVSEKSGKGIVTDGFSDVVGRYLRVTITGNTANRAAHIEEIKIYQSTATPTPTPMATPTPPSTPTPNASPSPTPTPSSGSQITSATATASSYNGQTYKPTNAIDGVESTSNYWGTSASNGLPQWLKIDLDSTNQINKITTHFYDGNQRTYTYYIETSQDGSTWTTVVATKTASSIVTDTFNQVTARYVRITVTGNTANTAAHIEEIKIYQGFATTPASTMAPTPSPTSSAPPSSSYVPLSCIGDDYLIYYNWNGNPSAWDSQLHWFTDYHCTGARLGFSFADDPGNNKDSTYIYAKMNSVLTKLSSVGVKAIICNFAGSDSHYYGTQNWINNWKQVATDFKGDTRIAAFEIANEPYNNYLASNADTMNEFNAVCASLIDQIRAIDSSRTIMMPIEDGIFTDSATAFYNSLVANGIPAKGNIMYDIVHPYYFQSPSHDGGNYGNPAGKADSYWYTYILPQINLLGVQNVWCGETFCWTRGLASPGGGWNGQININYNDQQVFMRKMINYFVSAGMGFQVWCFFTASDQQAQINAITSSTYLSGKT